MELLLIPYKKSDSQEKLIYKKSDFIFYTCSRILFNYSYIIFYYIIFYFISNLSLISLVVTLVLQLNHFSYLTHISCIPC